MNKEHVDTAVAAQALACNPKYLSACGQRRPKLHHIQAFGAAAGCL